jgi:hypothetical protein
LGKSLLCIGEGGKSLLCIGEDGSEDGPKKFLPPVFNGAEGGLLKVFCTCGDGVAGGEAGETGN